MDGHFVLRAQASLCSLSADEWVSLHVKATWEASKAQRGWWQLELEGLRAIFFCHIHPELFGQVTPLLDGAGWTACCSETFQSGFTSLLPWLLLSDCLRSTVGR